MINSTQVLGAINIEWETTYKITKRLKASYYQVKPLLEELFNQGKIEKQQFPIKTKYRRKMEIIGQNSPERLTFA